MRISDSIGNLYNQPMQGVNGVNGISGIKPMGEDLSAGKVQGTGKPECQTCKERKYQDGSDEMVSFKAAAHISPQEAGTRVRAHEQEHVSNAYKKAAKDNGKVLMASVRIQTSVCPECGRSYVSGGTTATKIQYKQDNPYDKNTKALQAEAFKGNHVDSEG